jgi:hypothetical protein
MSNFLSGLAVTLSTLACLFSGFAAYRAFNLEQEVGVSSRAVADLEQAQPSSAQKNPEVLAPRDPSPTPVETPSAAGNVGIQPGQFVQPTLENLGRIELLGVKRIQDPKTGNQDVVNILFRVYRLAEKPGPASLINISQTTARNPDTSEVYEAYGNRKSTGSVLLRLVKKNIPADGYVWLKVPAGVDTLDIYIPETQVFKNVPISN